MSQPSECVYEFDSFRLDATKRLLLRDGAPVSLTSKSFETLLALVERRGEVVSKDELMRRLWPDTVVEENNLTQQVSMLRKALGERACEHRYLVTVPGRGYSFVAEVREACSDEPALIVEQHTRSTITVDVEDERERDLPVSTREIKYLPASSRIVQRRWESKPALYSISAAFVVLAALLTLWIWSHQTKLPKQSAQKRSIAVLPFKSLAGDANDAYLGAGMTDTLIARLSNIRQINVRPTSAVLKYAGQSQQDAQAIGRVLGVDSVLEGTVQTSGDRVRVTVQMISTQEQTPLWAQSFDEKLTDIFAVQDAISSQVAQAMLVQLTGDEQQQLRRHDTASVEAYQEYLKGRFFWNKRNSDGLQKSLAHFQQAINLDPNYAHAYAGLADAYAILAYYQAKSVSADEAFRQAKLAVTKALSLNESLAEAHASLALIKEAYDHDEAGADSEYRRAITLNPNYATAHHWYSDFLAMSARQTEAMSEIVRAQELDPLSPIINTTLGERFFYARRYDESIAQLRKTLEIDPDFGPAHFILGMALEQKGMYEEAIWEFRKAREVSKDVDSMNSNVTASLGHTFAVAGKRDEAHKILNEMLAQSTPVPYNIAMIYQGLGEKQQAIVWLQKLKDKKSDRGMLMFDPRLDGLRSDPKFQELL